MQKCNKSVRFMMIMFLVLVFIIAGIGLVACNENVKSVEKMVINGGELVVTYTDGSTETLKLPTSIGPQGPAGEQGEKGEQGEQGIPGLEGIGVSNVAWVEEKLVFTLTDGRTIGVEIPSLNPAECDHEHESEFLLRAEGRNDLGERDCEAGAKYLMICDDCGKCRVDERESSKKHEYLAAVTVAPTCETEGYTCQHCKNCDQETEHTDIVAALGHDWEAIYTAEAGKHVCTDGGFQVVACKTCAKVATAADVEADAENEILASCVVDGKFANPTRINPVGHNFTTLSKKTDPTLTAKGALVGTCTYCGNDIDVEIPKLNRTDYVFANVEGKSCDQQVTYTLKSWKGLELNLVYTTAGNHIHGDIVYTNGQRLEFADAAAAKAAGAILNSGETITCSSTSPSHGVMICDDCGTATPIIIALPHTQPAAELITVVPATCTTKGSKTWTCTVCGEEITEEIEMIPHNFTYTKEEIVEDGKVVGYKVQGTCSVCDATKWEQPITAKKVEITVKTPSTCTVQGTQTVTLTTADDQELTFEDKLPLAKHQISGKEFDASKYSTTNPYKWTIGGANDGLILISGVEPSCGDSFQVGFVCSECNEFIQISAIVEHVAPATFTGRTEVCTAEQITDADKYECTRCHATVEPRVVGHKFGAVEAKVESDGTHAVRTCTVCNTVEDLGVVTIPDGAKPIESKASTCKVAGYDIYRVAVAGTEGTIDVKVARALLNHKFANGTEITPEELAKAHALDKANNPLGLILISGTALNCSIVPGVGVDYNGGVICAECGEFVRLYVSVPHTWADSESHPIIETPATCTTAGSVQRWCSECAAYRVDETRATPALGHIYKVTVTTQPTNTAVGAATITCTREGCDHSEIVELPALNAKVEGKDVWTKVVIDTNCQVLGSTTYSSTVKAADNTVLNVEFTVKDTTLADHDFVTPADDPAIWYTVVITIDGEGKEVKTYTEYRARYCASCNQFIVINSAVVAESAVKAGCEIIDITPAK